MKEDDVTPERKARVVAAAGGLVDETRVTIGIHGDDLDPDEVTALLRCPPSHSHRRGELRPRDLAPWPRGAWLLSVEDKAPAAPDHLLAVLLDRLPADPPLWAMLRARFDVRLGFGLFQGAWNRGFDLSPEVLKRVVDVGLGLDFDIYVSKTEDGG
jgi:hypothetical protein